MTYWKQPDELLGLKMPEGDYRDRYASFTCQLKVKLLSITAAVHQNTRHHHPASWLHNAKLSAGRAVGHHFSAGPSI